MTPGDDAWLPAIEEAFAAAFKAFGFTLPPESVRTRTRGQITGRGWLVQYLFGRDDRGEFLDYWGVHRMMAGERHRRIWADGKVESLESPPAFRISSPDPVEDARLDADYRAHCQRASAVLEAKGFIYPDDPDFSTY